MGRHVFRKPAAEASLAAADAALGQAIAAKGAVEAFRSMLHAEPYFLRTGFMPMRTRDAAVAWTRENIKALTVTSMKAETSIAGGLGYTWGRMSVATPPGDHYGLRPVALATT